MPDGGGAKSGDMRSPARFRRHRADAKPSAMILAASREAIMNVRIAGHAVVEMEPCPGAA